MGFYEYAIRLARLLINKSSCIVGDGWQEGRSE